MRTISRRMRLVGRVVRIGGMRIAYNIIVLKLEGKKPVERHRNRWEDNIKMGLRVRFEDANWIHLPQDKVQ
jgi:hypothetical protein